jgi:hypothetical protein
MARGSRRGQREAAALAALRASEEPVRRPGGERLEEGWTVRDVGPGDRAYRCPGCDQEVVGVPHVVAWRHDPDDRRHWHTPCWAARDRRRPR